MKRKKECHKERRRWVALRKGLPLSGTVGLMLLATVTALVPACHERQTEGSDTSRQNYLPAALKG